jgi:hypothetical protein
MIFFGLKRVSDRMIFTEWKTNIYVGGVGTSVGAANCCTPSPLQSPNYVLFYDNFGHYWHLSQIWIFFQVGAHVMCLLLFC